MARLMHACVTCAPPRIGRIQVLQPHCLPYSVLFPGKRRPISVVLNRARIASFYPSTLSVHRTLSWAASNPNHLWTTSHHLQRYPGMVLFVQFARGRSNQLSLQPNSNVYAMNSGKPVWREERKCGRHCGLPQKLIR